MEGLFRDIGALIFLEDEHVSAIDHFGSSSRHDPVFAPVFVTLKTQSFPGKDFDKLHLKILPLVENRIKAPRPFNSLLFHSMAPRRFGSATHGSRGGVSKRFTGHPSGTSH